MLRATAEYKHYFLTAWRRSSSACSRLRCSSWAYATSQHTIAPDQSRDCAESANSPNNSPCVRPRRLLSPEPRLPHRHADC